MKAIIYTRSATFCKRALKDQFEVCADYADKNGIVVVFVTSSIEDILNYEGAFDAVIVADRSRISRKAYEYEKLRNAFEMRGADIISVADYNLKGII